MILKTTLDTEKEMFVSLVWLLPPIPMLAVFVLLLFYNNFMWGLLLATFLWIALWGWACRKLRNEILFEGDKITIRLKQTSYVISLADVLYIEEMSFHAKPWKPNKYKIYMKPNANIPTEYLLVRNKAIQENLNILFPGVHITRNVVLD